MTVNIFDDNEPLWAASQNALANADAGEAIVSGCSVSKGSGDWESDVASGTVRVGGASVSVSADTVTHSDSSGLSSGESRVDLITADSAGSLSITKGTGASNPTSPDIPADEVVVGFWVIADSDSTLADSDLFDVPTLFFNQTDPIYGDGSDGTISRSSNANENGVIHATTYEVTSGTTMSVTNGVLVVFAQESITIDGTIDASGSVIDNGGAGGSGGGGAGDGGDGGGGGGVVVLVSPTVTINGTVDVSGQNGQNGQSGTATGTEANGSNGTDITETGTNGTDGTGPSGTTSGGSNGSNGAGGAGGGINDNPGGDGGDSTTDPNEPPVDNFRVGPYHPNLERLYSLALVAGNPGGGGGGGGEDTAGSNEASGGGGGGGGSGGIGLFVSASFTNNGTVSTSAGSGGSGGSGDNGGTSGGNGGNGDAGHSITVTV